MFKSKFRTFQGILGGVCLVYGLVHMLPITIGLGVLNLYLAM